MMINYSRHGLAHCGLAGRGKLCLQPTPPPPPRPVSVSEPAVPSTLHTDQRPCPAPCPLIGTCALHPAYLPADELGLHELVVDHDQREADDAGIIDGLLAAATQQPVTTRGVLQVQEQGLVDGVGWLQQHLEGGWDGTRYRHA